MSRRNTKNAKKEEEPEDEEEETVTVPKLFSPYRDDYGLAKCAEKANLPSDEPTDEELAFFPEIWENTSSCEVFLLVRNAVIATWQQSVQKEVTVKDVVGFLRSPFNSDTILIRNLINFLTRYGYINFGRFKRSTKINCYLPLVQRRVIVIGAGASGIAAATQLQSFGFAVNIVEARATVGGRCQSFFNGDQLIEVGCDAVRDIEKSPIATLMSQINVTTLAGEGDGTLFVEGKPMDQCRERLIYGMYENMRGALHWLSYQDEQRSENGMFVSRQRVLENLMSLLERKCIIHYYNYVKTTEEISLRREKQYKKLDHLRKLALMAEEKWKNAPKEDALLRRSLLIDISKTIEAFMVEAEAFELSENHLEAHKSSPSCKQYMNISDYKIYNHVLGCEELNYGAQLEKVQFTRATSDRASNGACNRVEGGIANLLGTVAAKRGVKIWHDQKVLDINTDKHPDRVSMKIVNQKSGEIEEVEANYVVCTLPIGVLKKYIQGDKRAPTFTPPLSDAMKDAIKCMGTALVNKVILTFEKNFWEEIVGNTFSCAAPSIHLRGIMLYWTSLPGSRTITTYYVGENSLHTTSDEMLIANAMYSLKRTFPKVCPKDPLKTYITRWHEDEYAFCTGSFLSLRFEQHHFEDIKKPLQTKDGKNRVYFAGEHTCVELINTLQGAWSSGVRAAADLANDHVGIEYNNWDEEPLDPPKETKSQMRFPPAPRQAPPPNIGSAHSSTPPMRAAPKQQSSAGPSSHPRPQPIMRMVRPLPPGPKQVQPPRPQPPRPQQQPSTSSPAPSASRVPPLPPRINHQSLIDMLPPNVSRDLTAAYVATLNDKKCDIDVITLDDDEDDSGPSTSAGPSSRPTMAPRPMATASRPSQRQPGMRPPTAGQQPPRHVPYIDPAYLAAMNRMAGPSTSSQGQGPSTSTARPSTSQYVLTRPSTSAYASSSRPAAQPRYAREPMPTVPRPVARTPSAPTRESVAAQRQLNPAQLPQRPTEGAPKPPSARMKPSPRK